MCYLCPGEQPVKNCLSDFYIPMELRNASPLGHQGQTIKVSGFSKAAGETRGGTLAGFRKAVGHCLDFVNPQTSEMQ